MLPHLPVHELQVLDSREIMNLPLIGPWVRQQSNKLPQARCAAACRVVTLALAVLDNLGTALLPPLACRRGVAASEAQESFVQPLITLGAPRRCHDQLP